MQVSVSQIVDALGGESLMKHSVHHEFDLMAVVDIGLPIESLIHLQRKFGFTNKTVSQLLSISENTYQRRVRAREKLSRDETEKVIALSEVYEKGMEVFENKEDFQEWLNSRILSLQQHRPIEFLDTVLGRTQVMRVLNAILHGIYL